MILLDGHSLTASRVVPVQSMSLQLKEKDATATAVPQDMTGITVNSWLLDDREPESGIVWRVKNIQQSYDKRTVTVSLDHVISTLKDRILFGEITPKTITGSLSATTCTARQAVEYILGRQSDWTLWEFDYDDVSAAYKFDGDTLYDALETVTNTLEDAEWTYDMSVYPFRLSIRAHSDDVDSELRAGRNLKTISRSVDMAGMFTRFYPIGRDDLHIDGDYVEKNVATYGVISKVETDQSLATEAELIAWANERLNAHAEPVVSISAEGLELSRETGESLDSFTIGRACRAPLPEFGTTIQERITEKSYPDKIGQPKNVKITMANNRLDVTKIIADALKKGGRGGRGSARQQKEDHAWFEDTNDHVAMVATGIIGVDAQGNPNWTRLSEFIADGEGLHAKVETQMGEAVERISSLEITEQGIQIDVAEAKSTIYTTIDVTAEGINQEVHRRAKVFVQIADPQYDSGVTLVTGDIWIKSVRVQNWNDMARSKWSDATSFNWNQYAGSPQFVWDGTRWEKMGDQGAVTEWGTRIEQTEKNITLLATAIGTIDPTAIASIDISADAITLAVSTAKSEIYSVIRQTSTNIMSTVVDDVSGVESLVNETANSLTSAIARKSKVFVQLTDPANDSGVTVIDGDIWIKSTGNDNIKQTWTQLGAKSWSSQSSTNWREYYDGYWYIRKNGVWQRMNTNADIVEIGTKLEQDENHIALIARNVDANHVELGSRLEVTAQAIRGEVHAASSSLYSVVMQTATSFSTLVEDTKDGLQSSITQTKSQIALVVTQKDGENVVDAASIVTGINGQEGSYVTIQASKINLSGYATLSYVNAQKARIDNLVNGTTQASSISTNRLSASNITFGGHTVRREALTIDGITYKLLTWT